jgi:hypothetical protein
MWAFIVLCNPISIHADKSRIYEGVTGIDGDGQVEHLEAPRPKIILSKKEIYHYEILEVFLVDVGRFDGGSFSMQVVRDGRIYPSAGMEQVIPFRLDNTALRAVYLPGWNQSSGTHEIELYYDEQRLLTDAPITFELLRRPLPDIEQGISIVDLEMNQSIRERSFVDPAGRRTDYSAILEWARFMNADMLWILAGETTTFSESKKNESPWDPGPLENLSLLKAQAPNYGIGIGAYIMSYYVPGGKGIPKPYEPGIGYDADNDRLYRARHISLACEQRLWDIVELAARFQQDPDIDYIGFDFIRTGRADGYELAEQVVYDTNIATPLDWEALSNADRIRWFARKIEVERDPLIIEKWRWWRAHRVAEIVKQVMEDARIDKPVWVFTLGWNHGKEHGQDPVMFFDAGVTYDAVMLYEASQSQFTRLLKHWNDYITEDQGNILVGSCVDYKLLDSEILSPPEEFFRRNTEAYRNVMRNGLAKGIFFHDIARAFWGRKGGYRFMDYAIAHMSSIYGLKKELKDIDLVVDVVYESDGDGGIKGLIQCKNNSVRPIDSIHIELLSPGLPVTITYYSRTDSHSEHEVTINPTDSPSTQLGSLDTFETVSVPFLIRNIGEKYRTLVFRVAIEKNNAQAYYIKEIYDL